jgi:hypothetical protein
LPPKIQTQSSTDPRFEVCEDSRGLAEAEVAVIDQPEDDLNIKIINDIVETLWQAKTHRQVIFASHNANLVVNGDAEFIICCDYRTTATESGGQIKCLGAIDVPEINREIAEVMEGGIEAFKLRYQKYGLAPVGLSKPEPAVPVPADVK